MKTPNRRSFIKDCAYTAASAAIFPKLISAAPQKAQTPKMNIFSKHLQFLDFKEMAKAASEIGFDGVDLTVRPNGHVEPKAVSSQLPRAVDAIRSAGMSIPMITTAVDDASDPTDQLVLETASSLGINYYRMNWFPYPENQTMPETIGEYKLKARDLSELNRKYGIIGCYQNHAGTLVGASLWEVWQMLQQADSDYFGVQYDIRHATVEGGLSWPNGFKLVKDRIKTIVVKDFKWTKKDGRTQIVNTPIGEGMVDFPKYFRMLKESEINAPFSLHLEYDIGGAQWGERTLTASPDTVFNAMSNDLETVRKFWAEA